jgi:tellurite methyltransferase
MKTDSAHVYWDAEWQKADEASRWAKAEAEVMDHTASLPEGTRVLDLGAGIGRHTLALARAGMRVAAVDASEQSVKVIGLASHAAGLAVDIRQGAMTDLPFSDSSFDHVLSWNVIYHGDERVVSRTVSEVRRVLRPGGTFMATMLSARRLPVEQAKAMGHEISPGCWVFEGDGDKVHPHYFCDAAKLVALLDGFELLRLEDRVHDTPGSWHWHLLAERL